MGNQLEGAKVISCATIANQDYSGKDFSGFVFRSCTFTNVIFKNAFFKDYKEALKKDALNSDEPVGRKLDFTIQELNREINTIEKVEKAIKKEKLQIKDVLLMTIDATGNHTIIRKENQ
mgnify:CR=1 FL=1